MGWLRHPHTTQERRVNGKRSNFIVVDGYEIKTRPSRNQINLPSAWDDLLNRSWDDRCWKRYRKTQYKTRNNIV